MDFYRNLGAHHDGGSITAQVIARTGSFSWGRAGTKGAAADSSDWEGRRRKRKLVQGTRLCKILKVCVKESGAGQDKVVSGFRKGKREG